MRNIIYALALVLVLLWALGYFVYNSGSTIHLLLVLALIAIILKQINGKELN